ncbi:MAG: hypothetical protein EPO24_09370 [Bacteroidetes bacterium]|nr:MAG: hypothetical protein EPO24_09370 [Bacteroidota bacterium]
MANPKFYFQDLTDVVFTSSVGDDASYPATNLNDYLTAPYWKSANNNASQYLSIDFGATGSGRKSICLSNHNLNGIMSSGTIKLQASSSSDFTTGVDDVDADLVVNSDPFIQEFTENTKRYWRILFNGNLSAIPYIGNLFIGNILDFGYGYEFPYRAADKAYETTERTSLDGTLRATQPYAGRIEFELNWKLLNDTFKTNWQAFHAVVRGRLRPFYFVDVDGTSIYYVKLSDDRNPLDTIAYQLNNTAKIKLKTLGVS